MARKSKVPKTIAGVKLPKPLRRGLRDLAATQTGRTAITEALEAAGAALDAQEAPAASGDAKPGRKKTAADGRAAAVQALEEAARAFTDTLRRKPAKAPPPRARPKPPPSAVTH
jgi:hypothetical protein